MSQFILLQSYYGQSGRQYDASCTGRVLTIEQARDSGLVTFSQQDRMSRGNYDCHWYEVNPGDMVTFDLEGNRTTFIVPPDGLPSPPTDVDRDFSRLGRQLINYFRQYALPGS